MRGKRSKQYRKLMQQYEMNFGFREPYQVLVDADLIIDAEKYKMDLILGLERVLNGKIKPMITQCSIRHLYALASEPGMSYVIEKAKSFERRRCGHLPSDHPEPLSTRTCILSVVDPKDIGTNKHRYIVASQNLNLRKAMRELIGVPLVYISRSVMIMEPMSGKTAENITREEQIKLRAGVKWGSSGLKRKKIDMLHGEAPVRLYDDEHLLPKKKAVRGVKGPNPLSVKKPKIKSDLEKTVMKKTPGKLSTMSENIKIEVINEKGFSRKRKRRHKSRGVGESVAVISGENN